LVGWRLWLDGYAQTCWPIEQSI